MNEIIIVYHGVKIIGPILIFLYVFEVHHSMRYVFLSTTDSRRT